MWQSDVRKHLFLIMVVRLVERKQANGLKHLFKRLFKCQTLPQDATSNGGDASRVGQRKEKHTNSAK